MDDLKVSPKNNPTTNNFTIDVPSQGLNTTGITVTANPPPNQTLPVTHPIAIKAVLPITNSTIFGPDIHKDSLYSNSSTNKITTTFSNLTVTLLPSLNLQQRFADFWTTYGPVISLIGGRFAAGTAALFFNRFFKTKSGTISPS